MSTCCGGCHEVDEPEIEESTGSCCSIETKEDLEDLVVNTVVSTEMTDLRNKVAKYEKVLFYLKEIWESGRAIRGSDMNTILSVLPRS